MYAATRLDTTEYANLVGRDRELRTRPLDVTETFTSRVARVERVSERAGRVRARSRTSRVFSPGVTMHRSSIKRNLAARDSFVVLLDVADI